MISARFHRNTLIGLTAALTLGAGVQTARAAELVTLANGFSVSCNHHAVEDGRVRLYTSAGSESYIEFRPDEITGVQIVPDPPAAPAATPQVRMDDANLSGTELRQLLSSAGSHHNLDVDLLASVVQAESGGNVWARSRTGAQGLMQLMPGTAAELGVKDGYRPDENVRGGSTYLDALLTRYHDNLALALAAYNAGPAAVDRYHGIPPYRETRLYVACVIREFNRRVRARETAGHRAGLVQGQ